MQNIKTKRKDKISLCMHNKMMHADWSVAALHITVLMAMICKAAQFCGKKPVHLINGDLSYFLIDWQHHHVTAS